MRTQQTKEQALKSAVRIYQGTVIHSKIAAGLSFVAYYDERRAKHGLIVYYGKSGKARAHYVFGTEGKREKYALEVVQSYAKRQKDTEERRAKEKTVKASELFTVGDVVYSSWGYDQTNVDWFQVVEIKAKSVVIRAIADNKSDHGGPCGGYTFPRRNEFIGEPMTKRVSSSGYVMNGRYSLSKWDGRKKYCSSYA